MIELKGENEYIEYKKSNKKLSNDIWETYSAFANTFGGKIILGISEEQGKFIVTGVENPDNMISDFWVTINNQQKISKNILDNRCIQKILLNGKTCIEITVPEAHIEEKPIYLNDNLSKTYIRRFSSDQLATNDEVASFMRNRSGNQDATTLDNYDIRDLNSVTISKYKDYLYQYTKDESIFDKSTSEFLTYIGAQTVDRNDGRKSKLTEAGLLFFGTEESIRSRFPHFHLDFFNRTGDTERWIDRVSFGDLNYPNLNIFEFYLSVTEKLKALLLEPFELTDNMTRKSTGKLQEALREACINMLVHADYHNTLSTISINVYKMFYIFKNPGCLRVTKAAFVQGGQSNPRNNILATLFRKIGLSERAGSGGPVIFSLQSEYDFRLPQIETTLNETELKIWTVEPINSIENIDEESKMVYQVIVENPDITVSKLVEYTKFTRYRIYKIIEILENNELIMHTGETKNRKYQKSPSTLDKFIDLDNMRKDIEKSIIN